MSARIIDGKAVAEELRHEVAAGVAALKAKHGLTPGLAVVLVGEDPASQVYVRNKGRETNAAGMRSIEHKLPATVSEAALLELIGTLNRDDDVHGILVQLPLPKHIESRKVIEAIDPDKDVDGFHAVNVGRLGLGERAFVPCTPAGSLILAKRAMPSLAGVEAVVIGRSNIVGRPMLQLLLQEDCTVTVAHSKTRDLPGVVRRADLVIAAVGRPEMVRGDWLKPGAVVIDVGINRVEDATAAKGYRLVGDVDFEPIREIASAMTPVPGGVGPMTVAMLMKNTVKAHRQAHA